MSYMSDTSETVETATNRRAYNRNLDNSGLSGDDINRRLREKRLGWKAPSPDWEANKGLVIRCIYPNQTITRAPADNDVFVNWPVAWADDGEEPLINAVAEAADCLVPYPNLVEVDGAGIKGLPDPRTTRDGCMQVRFDEADEADEADVMTNHMQKLVALLSGEFNDEISKHVARMVAEEHTGEERGTYTCTCNNWGPRWGENSLDGCCPGCWQWSLDHHQDMSVNGFVPPTQRMIRENTWGILAERVQRS